jgi:hypothetical protein
MTAFCAAGSAIEIPTPAMIRGGIICAYGRPVRASSATDANPAACINRPPTTSGRSPTLSTSAPAIGDTMNTVVVELLTDDALLTMPPEPLEYQGHDAIASFLAKRFATHAARRVVLVPTRANSQPAFRD